MPAELVSLVAGGTRWTAFRRVQVEASCREAARAFRLEIAAEIGAVATAWAFRAGTKVEVHAGGDLVLTGHVDRYEPRMADRSAEIVVSGRSKAADAIDSSAVHKTGRFEKKTVAEIAQELDAFGIGFKAAGALDPIPSAQIVPGETVFSFIERLARDHGLTLAGQADGSVLIGKAGEKPARHAGGLVEGQTILVGEASHDWSGRHSEIRVRGQRPFGHGVDNLEIEAVARDSGVDRYRPLVVVVEGDTDKGRALTATITVVGWRDQAGALWTPGRLVWVESPFLQLVQDMLIETVSFTQDDGGTIARLSLVDPRAHGGKAGKGARSGKAWTQDETDPDDTTGQE